MTEERRSKQMNDEEVHPVQLTNGTRDMPRRR